MNKNNITLLKINQERRKTIESGAQANSASCWTCGSCDFECPVYIHSSRLRPQVIVRLANLGWLDELMEMPEIWYCLNCRRCMHVCPNLVKPVTIIAYSRQEAIGSGKIGWNVYKRYQLLFSRFQRIRWRAVKVCLHDELDSMTKSQWIEWLNTPVSESSDTIFLKTVKFGAPFHNSIKQAKISSCFTCGECSSACPISCERSVFDPRSIFRMINLGMIEDLLKSPYIWLCIGCGRCSEVCSQLTDGQRMIDEIKEYAFNNGIVDVNFPLRLEKANRIIFNHFLKEIDFLFGRK